MNGPGVIPHEELVEGRVVHLEEEEKEWEGTGKDEDDDVLEEWPSKGRQRTVAPLLTTHCSTTLVSSPNMLC